MKQNSTASPAQGEFLPYSAMLLSYQAALHGCTERLTALRSLERGMKADAAKTEQLLSCQLERRIQLLQIECREMREAIESLRFYAERERTNEQRTMEARQ